LMLFSIMELWKDKKKQRNLNRNYKDSGL
jgi:hypothetical protein